MEKKFYLPAGGELMQLENSPYQMAISTVEDTKDIFDETGDISPRPVPGYPKENYIPWGMDDQLPYNIMDLVDADEVTSSNMKFDVQTCFGAGIEIVDEATAAPSDDKEIKEWKLCNFLPKMVLDQITDIKYYYMSVAIVIMSRDHRKIVRLMHKEACHCRLGEADDSGHIRYIYYANWKNGRRIEKPERIPLLDEHNPYGDLMARTGQWPAEDGVKHPIKDGKDCKFALLLRFPTVGSRYYPIPYWASIFKGGAYTEKRMISAGKRAKLKNSTSVKYQVEVEAGYFERICQEEGITDIEKAKARIKLEKEHIRDFVSAIENSGKVWISRYYMNPDGHIVSDIKINLIEGQKEGGDWSQELTDATAEICYAFGIHPNLVGATPGKQSNNSGSDKRELFVMKQALEVSFHELLLMPLTIVCYYNGWNAHPSIPMIMLTTLDEHTDAKKINPANHDEDGSKD